MDKHFGDAPVVGYEPLTATLDLPDADDRHVLAAAIQCSAEYVVTNNLADFPKELLARFDIEAITADAFLSQIVELHPSEAIAVLHALRRHYSNPPFIQSGFFLDLTAKGLPQLAATAERYCEVQ